MKRKKRKKRNKRNKRNKRKNRREGFGRCDQFFISIAVSNLPTKNQQMHLIKKEQKQLKWKEHKNNKNQFIVTFFSQKTFSPEIVKHYYDKNKNAILEQSSI